MQQFFECNLQQLSHNYPGLTLRRLMVEVQDILEEEGITPVHISSLPSPSKKHKVAYFLDQLLNGIPIEYIRKKAFFYQDDFFVDPSVLIPRYETEVLVDFAIQDYKNCDPVSFMEIGTGSGAIFSTLLQSIPGAKYAVGTDICPKAMAITRRNIYLKSYSFSKKVRVETLCTDKAQGVKGSFDFILTNPPYIKNEDRDILHHQVRANEPQIAIVIDSDKFEDWYSDLFNQCYDLLSEGGRFYLETHPDYMPEIEMLIQKSGFKQFQRKKDLPGLERFLVARK